MEPRKVAAERYLFRDNHSQLDVEFHCRDHQTTVSRRFEGPDVQTLIEAAAYAGWWPMPELDINIDDVVREMGL